MFGVILKTSKTKLLLLIAFLLLSVTVFPQSRSRIIGSIKDAKTGEPLIGANVVVMGTNLGAAADVDGKFYIINVPVGSYNVKASIVGYQAQIIENVVVSSDRYSELNFRLSTSEVTLNEVVVTANRDQLHKEVSSTQQVVTGNEMQNTSGIRDIKTFLEKLPGVTTNDNGFITIRGGSPDQTGTMINGLSFNNAAVGNSETSIPLSAIEQISVLSGGFNAEYGNFRSGLISVTTKTGSKSGYHGTINISADNSHMRRFGQSMYDAKNDLLAPFLDANIAFTGTANAYDKYELGQHLQFDGWNAWANSYNAGKTQDQQATPLDMYLLAAWMFMTEPDYAGLAKLGYNVSDEQKKLFAAHKMNETGSDKNFDAGFGGPVPFVSDWLGGATFYLSNNTSEKNYVFPTTRDKEFTSNTLLTLKTNPFSNLSVTFTGLWKRQLGVSPIQPANGDAPDASERGGFMSINNIGFFSSTESSDKAGRQPLYFYDPAIFPLLDQTTVMTGITINHLLSKSTYYELTLNRLSIVNHSPLGDNRDTTMITSFGPFNVDESPYNKWQFAGSHKVQGFTFFSYDAPYGISDFRFRGKEGDLYDASKTTQYQAKFDIASQLGEHNYVKAGFEYNLLNLNHNFWEKWNNNAYNTYEYNYDRSPSQTGFYLQDQITYNEIIANVGVRFDYYYGGGGTWPSGDPFAPVFKNQQNNLGDDQAFFDYLSSGKSYVWDLFEKYDQEHPGFLKPVENFFTVSPRIGISFPVTENSKFYFNYGHFRSNQPYSTMFQFQYRYTKNGLYRMSNPNLAPPRTIAYELGLAYSFWDSYLLRLSGYYKDVTGQYGDVTYRNETGEINYKLKENNEYEDIKGFEVDISKNDNSWITGWINFSYELKRTGHIGRSEVTNTTIGSSTEGLFAGDDSPTLPTPAVNVNITFRSPKNWGPDLGGLDIFGNWSMTLSGKWKAGSYFTFNPEGKQYLNNNFRWPDYFMLDLKLSKTFSLGNNNVTLYCDVNNLLNLQVSILNKEYAFYNDDDMTAYIASLHLPEFDSPYYAQLREQAKAAGNDYYIPGNDKIGDLRSPDKPYINNPFYSSFFMFSQPRDIWVGLKVDF